MIVLASWKLKILHLVNRPRMRRFKEELLRQQLLTFLADKKQFPKSLMVQEKKIATLPNIDRKCRLRRRIDLLIYTPQCKPLLLIECKAVPITAKAVKQILGYNYYIGAPCIAIVNQRKCILQWKEGSTIIYSDWESFPSYETCIHEYLQYG